MAQILDRPGVGAQLSGMLGRSLGTGISQLMQSKLRKMQTAQGLQSLGITSEQATQLAQLPPDIAKLVYPQVLKNMQRQRENKALEAMYPAQPTTGVDALQQLGDEGAKTDEQAQAPAVQPQIQGYTPGLALRQARAGGADVGTGLRLEQSAAKAAQAERMANKKLAFAETKQYRNDVDKAAQNSKMDLQNLREQKILVDSDKLLGPRQLAFLEFAGSKLGFDKAQIDAFKSGETQVFEKLSVPYFRNLKQVFGARPTQWDAQQIQKGFPSLYQTKAGKKVIIEHMENAAKLNVQEQKIKDTILSKNKGIPPLDLRSKVSGKMDIYRDERYLKLRDRVSKILVSTAGPKLSAAKAGKDTMVESDTGIIYISDGKNWKLLYSDSKG